MKDLGPNSAYDRSMSRSLLLKMRMLEERLGHWRNSLWFAFAIVTTLLSLGAWFGTP